MVVIIMLNNIYKYYLEIRNKTGFYWEFCYRGGNKRDPAAKRRKIMDGGGVWFVGGSEFDVESRERGVMV